jgi:hypothetical protein
MLDQVRTQFLRVPGADVRVILTGGPFEVGESNSLKDNTPMVTLRPINLMISRRLWNGLRLNNHHKIWPRSRRWQIPPDDELEVVYHKSSNRRLRGYSFAPSLSAKLETGIHQ